MSYDEHLISMAGGDGENSHATFCDGQHVMGESPCVAERTVFPKEFGPALPVKMVDVAIYIRHDFNADPVLFTNVPLSIVEEAIAHINDNSDPASGPHHPGS